MNFFLTICLLPSLLLSQDKFDGLELTFVCETKTIVPGTPFVVGLHIQHEEGFHTYWQNPGIVGVPTTLKWELPEGFSASEISWPYPEISDMVGHPCHGYERDVTLLTTITPPKNLTVTEVPLKAIAQWMCCAHTCFPGNTELSLTLPVGEKKSTDPKGHALITQAQNELPKRSESWTLSMRPSKVDAPLEILFTTTSEDTPSYFFSTDGQISSNLKQIFEPTEKPKQWLLKIKRAQYAPENKGQLQGVLRASKGHHLLQTQNEATR